MFSFMHAAEIFSSLLLLLRRRLQVSLLLLLFSFLLVLLVVAAVVSDAASTGVAASAAVLILGRLVAAVAAAVVVAPGVVVVDILVEELQQLDLLHRETAPTSMVRATDYASAKVSGAKRTAAGIGHTVVEGGARVGEVLLIGEARKNKQKYQFLIFIVLIF